MSILKLADVTPVAFNRGIVDPRFDFFNTLHDRKSNYNTHTINQSLFYRYTDIPENATMFHKNYLEYLKKCWQSHLGIVITPDIIWFTLLTEFASVVREKPEDYRSYFSESKEKQTILVQSDSLIDMPVDRLITALKSLVPTDMGSFLPKFSTATPRSTHAMYSAFCDVVSPYYDYMMFCCGFPAIDIRGTIEDWKLLAESWRKISSLFTKYQQWASNVQETLNSCVEHRENADWWKTIFTLDYCGSGSDVDINGWYSRLFRVQPQYSPRNICNFPTCLAVVDYKQLETQKNYRMRDGVLFSQQEGIFMVPDFGYAIHEVIEVEPEHYSTTDWRDQEKAMKRFIERTQHLQ